MQPARISELLDPFFDPADGERLTANDLDRISTYIDILRRWNSRINLTAIRAPEEIVTRHFGESLFAARHLFPRPHRVGTGTNYVGTAATIGSANDQRLTTNDRPSLADLGSGAGFPGIPIKLWAPEIALTLIESSYKKAAFLREVTRVLTLMNVNIQNARAESLPQAFGVVTLRAVERFEAILPTAASLVAPAGRLALLIGAPQLDLARRTLPNLSWPAPLQVPNSQSRILVIAHRSA